MRLLASLIQLRLDAWAHLWVEFFFFFSFANPRLLQPMSDQMQQSHRKIVTCQYANANSRTLCVVQWDYLARTLTEPLMWSTQLDFVSDSLSLRGPPR